MRGRVFTRFDSSAANQPDRVVGSITLGTLFDLHGAPAQLTVHRRDGSTVVYREVTDEVES